MLNACCLQSLYCRGIQPSSPLFEQIASQFFFQSQPIFPEDLLEECLWEEPLFSEEKMTENWKRLLALNVLCDLADVHPLKLPAKVRFFERRPWNQSSQYVRSLVALNHAFARMPIPEVTPQVLASGAALIDICEYTPWLSLPYTPHHFEFGIFLAVLSLLGKRQDLQDIVLRMAHWQLNTLSVEGKPLSGLFVREKDTKTLQHQCLSYLLFRSAALFTQETPFAAIAEAAIRGIQQCVEEREERMEPLWALLEKWLAQYQILSCAPFQLSEQIHDSSTALVGYRSSMQHIVCTLHGGYTGLGALRQGGIEIVSYGPQYLPLGECEGFGIEGNALSDHGMRRSTIEWQRHSFVLKGCVRLVDQPSSSLSGGGKFRGIWLDVVQEFKKPHFYLKTTFLGLDGWESVAFSFFVKAVCCKVGSQVLYPRTFERYEGEAQLLLLEGEGGQLELCSLGFMGRMQIIPLVGDNHFWGADFLVAYFMMPEERHYQWHISAPI